MSRVEVAVMASLLVLRALPAVWGVESGLCRKRALLNHQFAGRGELDGWSIEVSGRGKIF